MNILITGGAGFIGSELGKALLLKGHVVTILDNLEYGYKDNFEDNPVLSKKFILEDIRSPNMKNHMENIDILFHFAGISSLPECESNPYKAFDVNTSSVAHVLSLCRDYNIKRFIFASTSAVYENNDPDKPFNEGCLVSPNLIYATTKYSAEQICKSFAYNYDMDIVICRFFNVFGAHQDYKRKHPPFTSYLIREILNNRVPTIFNTSDVKRDYIYIDDLVEFLYKISISAKKYKADIFNLSSGSGYSAVDIVNAVFSTMKRDPKYNTGDPEVFWDNYTDLFDKNYNLNRERVKKEVFKHCIGDNRKAVEEFNYKPIIDLLKGIHKIIEFQNKI